MHLKLASGLDVTNFRPTIDVSSGSGTAESNEKDKHMYELVSENKRLWIELKKKDELTIALRDDIYFKQRQLEELSRSQNELEWLENNEESVALIREVRKLKADLREKQILVNFLSQTLDHMCDQVLQNEQIESMEAEMQTLETENQILQQNNAQIKKKLELVEHDNEKVRARSASVETENRKIKTKLEKFSKRLRQKEHSILDFKKFTELAYNLQSRILRTKSENNTLKKVIDQMKQVADNYQNLESENLDLQETIRQLQDKNKQLVDDVRTLRDTQVKIAEHAERNPEILEENAALRRELAHLEHRVEEANVEKEKLKSNLSVYEKVLVENKVRIEEAADHVEVFDILTRENKQLKMNIDALNDSMQQLLSDKGRLVQDNQRCQTENREYVDKLSSVEKDKMNLMAHISTLNRDYEEALREKDDLKRQLDVYRNTVHNVEAALKLREEGIRDLQQENNELKLRVKQYENQIQMAGKVYKLVR